jgi:hypothetical protein
MMKTRSKLDRCRYTIMSFKVLKVLKLLKFTVITVLITDFRLSSQLMLILPLSLFTFWRWAVLLMFSRYMLPPSSGSKQVGWVALVQ